MFGAKSEGEHGMDHSKIKLSNKISQEQIKRW